jgi:hypothetical protein
MTSDLSPPKYEVMGELTEEETQAITRLRQNANQLLNQLGQLELRKTRVAFQIERNESQAQEVVASARERLEIPEGTPWQIQENGTVVAILSESSEEVTSDESSD